MKPYHILSCNYLADIQQQVITWIENKHRQVTKSKALWNKIDTLDLLKSSPALIKYFGSLDLKLREASLTVIPEPKKINLHIDEMPVTAKINIPIMNTTDTYNRWYKVPKHIMESTEPIVNKFGNKFYNFEDIDYSALELVAEVETIEPMVFNSQIAHNIVLGKDSILPRIVLACTFFNEPIQYLKN
jgi:hypothetical protein